MPEIIEFSNRISYPNLPLVPLRQFGSGRLTPVVSSVFVASGVLKGSGQRVANPEEASAIIDWIRNAVQDPKYKGKTFGVISLRGDWQAREIERGLVHQLGPEVFGDRQIVCGDAYAFQGDERDVILLSMVVAPSQGHTMGVLNKEDDRRRFNVAASRARDQMVLFHSVQPSDLNQKCFRYALLSYCLSPTLRTDAVGDLKVEDLRARALRADRSRMALPEPFESWFEVDVFLRVVDRGLKVLPQYRVHGYRIDMVVETLRDRVAVECDGDHWHGPDQYESDMGRQRELERCGWTFYRIPESSFRLDPDQALAGLWPLLEARSKVSEDLANHPPLGGRSQVRVLPREFDASSGFNALAVGKGGGSSGGNREWTLPAPEAATDRMSKGVETSGVPKGSVAKWAGSTASSGNVPVRGVSSLEPSSDPQLELATLEWSHGLKASGAPLADVLKPYVAWPTQKLPNPMVTGPELLLEGAFGIIFVEGPIMGRRLSRLLAENAPGKQVPKLVRHNVHAAIWSAFKTGRLVIRKDPDSTGMDDSVVRLPHQSDVKLRLRGPRTFDEIPSSEIAAMIFVLLESEPTLVSGELYRAVTRAFGFNSMTPEMLTTIQAINRRRNDFLSKG